MSEREDSPGARERIAAEAERTRAQIEVLTQSFDAIVEAAAATPPDDEHDPDGATVGFERAQAAALIEVAQTRLGALDAALRRVDAGTYGRCSACGERIGGDRLIALPAAATCIDCASGSPRAAVSSSRPSPTRRSIRR